MKGKEVIVDGYFGKEKQYLLPIPNDPPTIISISGWKWLYLGDTDEDLIRVAKSNKDGTVDIASLCHLNRNYFPDLDANNQIY